MPYRIRVKPSHPTGRRRRSGVDFTEQPIELEQITEEMRADPWLQIASVKVEAQVQVEEEPAVPDEEKDPDDPTPRRGRRR